jgi:spermidine synthase
MRGRLHVLFFLSGASSLIYELIWHRYLNLLFGVSTLAVSAVLAAFMGGLALGGALFGRRADRARHPLRLYALLEGGIAAGALLVPIAFAALAPVYTALYTVWQPPAWLGTWLRFAIAFSVLLGPTTLIGGTFPVMGRLATDAGARLGTRVSLLYGVNTLGAVLGAALTGFVFLHHLGMAKTLWLAAALNALVGGAAVLLSRGAAWPKKARRADLNPPRVLPCRSAIIAVLGCAFLTGCTGLGLEVAWARILGIFTSNSAYAFALVLTVVLFGIGSGSVLQAWWSRYRGDRWIRLGVCQVLLALYTVVALGCVHTAPAWLDRWCDGTSVFKVFLGEGLLTTAVLLVPAILMGMSFPLLAVPPAGISLPVSRWLGRVYAVNTLGGVAGAFLTGLVLIPRLEMHATLEILAVGSLAVALIAIVRAAQPAWRLKVVTAAGIIAGVVVMALWLPGGGYFKSPVHDPRHLLYYREGENGTVCVIEEADRTRSILVDGQPVAGTAGTSVIDQKMLAHLPLLLHPAPRRALTVGFGSGGTSYSMTLHDIDVDCVEIEKAVPGAAFHFASENHGVLANPRFHLVVEDARSWLRVAPTRYDVIVTDCTNLQYKSNGDLYTVDYFRLMKDRLTPQGVAAAWVPANGIDGADLKTLLRSFRRVFPHTSVWFMNTLATDFLIVVGTPGPLEIDLEQLRRRMARPGVRQDLLAVGLEDPFRLLYTFLTAGKELSAYLGAGPVNTDDRPVLSYSTYGASFRPTIAGNLVQLLACRADVARYVRHAPASSERLRHYAASNEALLGHISYQTGDNNAALLHYAKGARLLDNDPAFRQLVTASYLQLTLPFPGRR